MDNYIFKDRLAFGIFCEILARATEKGKTIVWNGLPREIPPESVFISIKDIGSAWGVTPRTARKKLDYLYSINKVTLEVSRTGSLITPCDGALDVFCCAFGITKVLDTATPKVNKDPRKRAKKYTAKDFEEIYSLYPEKQGKKKGMERCVSQVQTEEKLNNLRLAVENYKRSGDVKNGYIKHFSTFMNCWEDYIHYERPKSIQETAEENLLLFMENPGKYTVADDGYSLIEKKNV